MYEGFYPLLWFLFGFICGALIPFFIVVSIEDESE